MRQIVHFFQNCRSERSRAEKWRHSHVHVFILDIMVDSDNKTQLHIPVCKMVKVRDMSILQEDFEQIYHFNGVDST